MSDENLEDEWTRGHDLNDLMMPVSLAYKLCFPLRAKGAATAPQITPPYNHTSKGREGWALFFIWEKNPFQKLPL